MAFQRKKLASALALALGGGAIVGAAPAAAQDIRVEVTGSNIRRVEAEGALPVTVLTREDIARTGAQSASEILSYLSANSSTGQTFVAQGVGATTYSASIASLRGLGGQATLVLVNGKRLSNFSGEIQGVYGVNLDAIPFSAIERVEVLTDGASAVYGSDAIGGVINYIMRQEFQGVEVGGYYAAPTRSGSGDSWNVKATAGWGDLARDKFNIWGTVFYEDRQPVYQNQRDFSNTSVIPDIGLNGTSGNTFPAFISTGGIGNTSFPNCAPSVPVGTRCRYDPANVDGNNSVPDAESWSLFTSGRWQFHPDWQLYGTAAYSQQKVNNVIQPVPISDQFFYGPNGDIPSSILLPPSSPFYPTQAAINAGVNGQPLNIRYRSVETGNRDSTDENSAWQVVVGTKGSRWNWDFDLNFAYSKADTTTTENSGKPDLTLVLPLLRSGLVNPFGPNSPEITQQLRATNFTGESFNGESTGWVVEGKGTSDLFKLPAGPLAGAFGFQIGEQTLEQNPAPALASGNISGFGGNQLPIDASRDWWAVFAEFNIPIVKTLELNAAVRYDDYSDFGGTTNPKFSLRWTPVRELLVRGSWGTSFIAPSLTQAYGGNTSGVTAPGQNDPLRCPTTGDSNDCDTQFPVTFGGNDQLKPQTATQWQVGFVFEPARQFSIGMDYFNIDTENLFSNGLSQSFILSNLDTYGYLVRRGPVQPQYPNLPGPITNIDQRYINVGRTQIEGIDINLAWNSPSGDWGSVQARLNGTYYMTWDETQIDGSIIGRVANQYEASNTGVVPRYKQFATVTWLRGPWSVSLGNTYQSDYIDWQAVDFTDEGEPITRRVDALSLWDLSATYSGFKDWRLALGVKNLLDTNPPLSNQQNSFQSGYDPSYYDARARFVWGSVTYSFK